MAKVLLVEDDPDVQFTVNQSLTREQYTVEVVGNGIEGLERLAAFTYDVIILDIDLPGKNGVQVCQEFRAGGGRTPVLMLTGKGQVTDKATGLDAGADDYLTKPYDIRELLARLRALLRRPQDVALSNVLQYKNMQLDTARRVFKVDGQDVYILPRDFELLEFFMRHQGEVFSSEALLDRVWHADKEVSPDALRSSLKRIRQKIGDTECSIISNLPKIGYRFGGE